MVFTHPPIPPPQALNVLKINSKRKEDSDKQIPVRVYFSSYPQSPHGKRKSLVKAGWMDWESLEAGMWCAYWKEGSPWGQTNSEDVGGHSLRCRHVCGEYDTHRWQVVQVSSQKEGTELVEWTTQTACGQAGIRQACQQSMGVQTCLGFRKTTPWRETGKGGRESRVMGRRWTFSFSRELHKAEIAHEKSREDGMSKKQEAFRFGKSGGSKEKGGGMQLEDRF